MAENKIDVSFLGFMFLGALLLFFGVYGLQLGGLFQDIYAEDVGLVKTPLSSDTFALFAFVVGFSLLIISLFAYKGGNKTTSIVFATIGAFSAIAGYNVASLFAEESNGPVTLGGGVEYTWFLFIALAAILLLIALYVLLDRAPKFIAILLLLVAVMFVFFGLYLFYIGSYYNDGLNLDIAKIMGILTGIFGFLSFVIAAYLGLAYATTRDKLPLI